MLITTCTQCLARFRVTPQQLNAKQGQVRCGRCGKVFSGFEALERVPDDDTGSRLLAAREAADAKNIPAPRPHVSEELPELEAIDASYVPAAPAQAAPAPPPTPSPPRRPAAAVVDLPDEEPPVRVSRAWSFGVALLLLVIGCEAAYAFRAPLAQGYPPLRPWLESACARIGCTVPWQRDERLLKLEDSQLLEVPGRADQIALGARIRNLASVAQEYPYLELTLTDVTGQQAARKVLRPADYLGHAPARDEVLAPGAEVAIQLRLATASMKATGYELLLFYP
ncbi:MAG TPA: zinc-ribbon and DUF3426 domain-containing protein [Usitatibacter sp.]|jgi:predicted Zn finger-like uncharacterized protein|nr:zinc-ribbon and DUF3426 domain-containing protein [Usitatibacter sp.]